MFLRPLNILVIPSHIAQIYYSTKCIFMRSTMFDVFAALATLLIKLGTAKPFSTCAANKTHCTKSLFYIT